MRWVSAVDRRRGEALIRQAHVTAAMTGAAWAGKLEPLSAYLTPSARPAPARGDPSEPEL